MRFLLFYWIEQDTKVNQEDGLDNSQESVPNESSAPVEPEPAELAPLPKLKLNLGGRGDQNGPSIYFIDSSPATQTATPPSPSPQPPPPPPAPEDAREPDARDRESSSSLEELGFEAPPTTQNGPKAPASPHETHYENHIENEEQATEDKYELPFTITPVKEAKSKNRRKEKEKQKTERKPKQPSFVHLAPPFEEVALTEVTDGGSSKQKSKKRKAEQFSVDQTAVEASIPNTHLINSIKPGKVPAIESTGNHSYIVCGAGFWHLFKI